MKKRIISLILSVTVLLVLLLVTIPAYATETNIFILEPSTETPSPGGTITYTLSLKNAKAITAFGFNIELPSCLSLDDKKVALNTDKFGATLEFVPENGYQVLWYSGNGEDFTSTDEVKILEFECTVSEDAQIGSEYKVTLTNILEAAGSGLQYAEISTEVYAAPHTLSIAEPVEEATVECIGNIDYEVNGQIITVDHEAPCKVGYLSGDKYVAVAATANGDGTYSFTVPDGITEALLVVNSDVNGDSLVTAADAQEIQRYAAALDSLISDAEISYWFFVTDVNGDGLLTAADAQEIQRYAAGLESELDS